MIKITTPASKQEIELKSFITAREKRQIDGILMAKTNIDQDGKLKMDGAIFEKMQDKTLEIMVISIAGSKEKILDTLLNMDLRDFNFIKNKIDEITSGVEEKKTE
jgi:hypothetical protein